MPRTLANHLVGVSTHQPHPESYRPDLPLTHLVAPDAAEAYSEGYDEGYDDGDESGYHRGYVAGDSAGAARVQRQAERPSA
jgi:hypothetical protein